jgi:hypothetical protein
MTTCGNLPEFNDDDPSEVQRRRRDEACAMNEAYFSGKMTAPDWTRGSRAALPNAPAGKPSVGKSIVLD